MQRRQEKNSAEFVLVWEHKLALQTGHPSRGGSSSQEPARATARIQLNAWDEFLKFDVELGQLPIVADVVGKDVMVDWYFDDDFDTAGNLYVDANGLQMIDKKLFHRKVKCCARSDCLFLKVKSAKKHERVNQKHNTRNCYIVKSNAALEVIVYF